MSEVHLHRLQEWYARQCDGSWEHGHGIKIETLDNPGWRLSVNLSGTRLEKALFDRVEVHRSEEDWIVCWLGMIEGLSPPTFEAAGGARNLGEVLAVFLDWADEVTPTSGA